MKTAWHIKKAAKLRPMTDTEIAVINVSRGLSAQQARAKLMAVLAVATLKEVGGSYQAAAEVMGVHRNTFTRIIKSGIRNPREVGNGK